MLKKKDAATNIAVKDLEVARIFYRDTLGLEEVGAKDDQVITFKSGNSLIYVYRSEFAGTNKATAITWLVAEELNDIVKSLKSKGVEFEYYDFPGMTRAGEIHSAGTMQIAWFKDPDGNILSITNG
ncbi:MAG: VOC family protein [Candidatus Kapaibacterium sp.]|jgi:catechol 2,3-dioxygenase-like lactoylglutathione lyase family enzyme